MIDACAIRDRFREITSRQFDCEAYPVDTEDPDPSVVLCVSNRIDVYPDGAWILVGFNGNPAHTAGALTPGREAEELEEILTDILREEWEDGKEC